MIGARYDGVVDSYVAGFSDPSDPVVVALLDLLGPVGGLRVVDVACGHGRVTRELARRGAAVTGVDVSRALLEKADAAEAARPLGIRYMHADAASVPGLDDEGFDVAVCSFGLSDIDDLDGALATLSRVLRAGGVFVFSILHPCFPGAGTISGAWATGGSYYDEGWWTADGASSTLRRQVGANHRTVSTYLNALARHGLFLTQTCEPPPPAEWAHDGWAEAARLPVFFLARCTKGLEPQRPHHVG